jgi:hypothetical protein
MHIIKNTNYQSQDQGGRDVENLNCKIIIIASGQNNKINNSDPLMGYGIYYGLLVRSAFYVHFYA